MRPGSWRGSPPKIPRSPRAARRPTTKRGARAKQEAGAELRSASAESALAEAQAAASDLNARRRSFLGAVEDEGRRLARLETECEGIERERAALRGLGFEETEREARAKAVADLAEALAAAERETLAAEERHAAARADRGRVARPSRGSRARRAKARDRGADACRPPRLGCERPLAPRGRCGQRRPRL